MMAKKTLSELISEMGFCEDDDPFYCSLVSLKMPKRPVYGTLFTGSKKEKRACIYNVRDENTGETFGVTRTQLGFYMLKDDAEFLKIFPEPLYSSIKLTSTARRVFDAILEEYGKEPLSQGYVNRFYFKWYGNGANGGHTEKTKMSRDTFNRGMCELLEKRFVAPRRPDEWAPNPLIFFKGNRAKYLEALREHYAKKNERELEKSLQRDVHDK